MALVKVKPTSPGRRAVIQVVNHSLHKGAPVAGLLEPQSKHAGRNNNGHITTRHQGGGHKQHYRLVDFKRNKDGVPAKVERLEYDPNRTARIALLQYEDGERLSPAEHPLGVALRERRPAHLRMRMRGLDGSWRLIESTSMPVEAQGSRHLGAFAMFWEVAQP